jgi:hypothetical protein
MAGSSEAASPKVICLIQSDRDETGKLRPVSILANICAIDPRGSLSLGVASSITPARADADDAAWIKKCVNDNKREGATPEVVAAWCSCMNTIGSELYFQA